MTILRNLDVSNQQSRSERRGSLSRNLAMVVLATALATGAAGQENSRSDREKLQGAWTCVYMERNGKAIPVEKYRDGRLVMEGDTFTYTDRKHLVSRGIRKLDPTKSPKALDDTHAEGVFKGRTYLGIYELNDDTFKTCNGSFGQPRPTSFVTTPGSGLLLVVYKRAEP
jgi:uncharacterized protein (TIGR03067 family)